MEAVRLYKAAASLGSSEACLALARIYDEGVEVVRAIPRVEKIESTSLFRKFTRRPAVVVTPVVVDQSIARDPTEAARWNVVGLKLETSKPVGRAGRRGSGERYFDWERALDLAVGVSAVILFERSR